jgi:hypothetical protein
MHANVKKPPVSYLLPKTPSQQAAESWYIEESGISYYSVNFLTEDKAYDPEHETTI